MFRSRVAVLRVVYWLDDHSRYLLSCTVHRPVRGDDVVTVFLAVIDDYGPPASTLTDNGSVYTSRFTGGRNAFEYLLPLLGIRQKNGSVTRADRVSVGCAWHPGRRRLESG